MKIQITASTTVPGLLFFKQAQKIHSFVCLLKNNRERSLPRCTLFAAGLCYLDRESNSFVCLERNSIEKRGGINTWAASDLHAADRLCSKSMRPKAAGLEAFTEPEGAAFSWYHCYYYSSCYLYDQVLWVHSWTVPGVVETTEWGWRDGGFAEQWCLKRDPQVGVRGLQSPNEYCMLVMRGGAHTWERTWVRTAQT